MTKRQSFMIKITVAIAIVIVILWVFKSAISNKESGKEISTDEGSAASVLIKTQTVKQQTLPSTLQVYGDVATGRAESLSFPQAGQITQLAIVQSQPMHKGDVIAIITSDPAARSAYLQAQTALEFAKRELPRIKDLFALQLATQSQVDSAEKQLSDAESALVAQAKLGGAKESVTLTAPFAGVITSVLVTQGDRVQAGTAVVQLGRTDDLRIQLGIEPVDSDRVHVGMPVVIKSVQDETRNVATTITEMQSAIDPKTQMVTAIAALSANNKNNLLVGMQVEAEIQLDKQAVWTVPRQAILNDDKGAYLFQVLNHKAIRVDVEKIVELHQLYGVEGKINNALPVVILGNYELEDGSVVREEKR